jgi:hypothetical protein
LEMETTQLAASASPQTKQLLEQEEMAGKYGQYLALEKLSAKVDEALAREYSLCFGAISERNAQRWTCLFREQVQT